MSKISGDDDESLSTGGEEGVAEKLNFKQHSSNSNVFSSTTTNSDGSWIQEQQSPQGKRKRNPPGNPDPTAQVVALSPKTLMATNRFVCEICQKGFQRDQNLQLHRRGHNLPWKLRQRTSTEPIKRVYVCPEPSCVHHNPARALGDLTGIKKHYSRKHGEKQWECEKCSKKYAVKSDWKAHSKTCGTKEYKCDCGTIFSRRDSFVTHRAFCEALAEENSKANQGLADSIRSIHTNGQGPGIMLRTLGINKQSASISMPEFSHSDMKIPMKRPSDELMPMPVKSLNMTASIFSSSSSSLFGSPRNLSTSSSCLQLRNDINNSKQEASIEGAALMSATALLQKANQIGATVSSNMSPPSGQKTLISNMAPSSYSGMIQQRSSSYGDLQNENYQSNVAGLFDGYASWFAQRKPQETSVSEFVDTSSNNMGTYSSLLNQNLDFLNHMEGHPRQVQSDLILENGSTRRGGNSTNFFAASSGSNDSMTLDLFGIRECRPVILHEMQQQEMNFEAVGQQRIKGLSTFQQHIDSNQVTIPKPVWDA